MARKTNFEGDVFGAFTVLRRANAQNSKRFWWVVGPDGVEREIAQTELAGLDGQTVVVPNANDAPALVEVLAPAPVDAADNPFHPYWTYAEEFNATQAARDAGRDADDKIPASSAAEPRDPNWIEKAVALHKDPKRAPVTGVRDVLERLGVVGPIVDEAIASIALDKGDVGTYSLNDLDPFSVPGLTFEDELAEVLMAPIEKQVVTRFGGIGECAEEGVSEAELDERVPPADPARKLVRLIMGQVHDVRQELMAIEEMRASAQLRTDGLMELADQLMKDLLTR